MLRQSVHRGTWHRPPAPGTENLPGNPSDYRTCRVGGRNATLNPKASIKEAAHGGGGAVAKSATALRGPSPPTYLCKSLFLCLLRRLRNNGANI